MTRAIGAAFMQDLKSGILAPLTAALKSDDTLLLALRGRSINVYYRGGNILQVFAPEGSGGYRTYFDENYAKAMDSELPKRPASISSAEDCAAWIQALPGLKQAMNSFYAQHPKPEREFQQLVAWENNRSKIANSTEYFITDIEYADATQGARLDMLGLKWLASDRKNGKKCQPVFVEMKYGIDAYGGVSGIQAHLNDLSDILADSAKVDAFRGLICEQFTQLEELGLVRFERSASLGAISAVGRPEVIFLFANHNPRSGKLLDIVKDLRPPAHFDLKFFAATFAGYAMHEACMLDQSEFCDLLSRLAGD